MEAREGLPSQPFLKQSASQSENRRASLVGLRGKGLVAAGMAKFTRGGDEHDVLQASDAKKPGGGKTKFGASLFGPRKSVDSITAMREAAQQEDEREPSIHSSLEALPSIKRGNILARLLTRSTKKKTALSPSPSASSGSAASPVAGKQLFNKFDTAAAGADGHESDGYESANSHPPTPKRHDADQQRGADFLDASYSMDVSPGPHYAEGIDITLTPGMIQQQKQAAQRRQADSSYECDPTQVLISKEMLGHGNLPMLSPALVGKESAPMDISPLPMQQQGPSHGFAFGQQADSPQNDTPVLAAGGSPGAASGAQQEVERMLAASRPDASPEYTPAPSDTTMMDLDTPLTFTIAKTLQFRPDSLAAAQEPRSLVASISQLLDAAAPTPKQEAAPAAAAAEPASPARTIPTMLQDSTAPGAFGSPNPVAPPASPMLQGTPVAPSPATALASVPLEPQVTLESELPGRANPPGSPATPATGIKQDISRNLSVGRLNSKLSKLSVMEGAASDAHEEQEEESQEADITAAEAEEQPEPAAADDPAPEAGAAVLAAVDEEEDAAPALDSMEHDGDVAQEAAPVDVADIDVQLADTSAPPTADPSSSSSKPGSAMKPSSPFAEQVPAAVLAAAPPSPAAAQLAPSEQVSSPTLSAAEGLASHAVSVELEMMDSVQSAAAEPAPQAAAAEAPVLQSVEEQPSHDNMAMDADEPEAAVEGQEPALAQSMQQGQAADGGVEAMDDFEELERQLAAEAEQQQPAGAAAAAQVASGSPAAMQMTPAARTTAGSGLFSAGKRTGLDTPDFGSQAPQPAKSTSPDLQQAFGIAAQAAGTCSPPAATSQPQRDMSSPGLLNLDASEDDLLHGMQELSRGSFADFALSGSQPMDLAMPERTPSPAAEHQREQHHRPTSAVRESIPLFTSSPMALDGGHAPSLDDEDMDLRQSRAVPQGLYASTAAYASNLETVQEAAYEGSMGSPTASSIISDGSISRKSSKAGSASPPGHQYHKSQGIGRSTSKMGAATATPLGQEQGSGRQQSSKSASALKKLASGKTPKTAPRASGIPTPGSGMGSGRRAAQHPPARTPTAAASSGYAGANVTPYTAGHQQQQHSASKTGPLHHNPDLQLSDMDTPTMGHSGGMPGPSPTLPLDIRAAFGAAGGAAHGMRAAAAAAPSPSLVWQQDLHKTPIMAQMRNMPIEAAVNAPLLDSSPFPDDMDTRCLQEEARRLAIAMGEQATPSAPGDGDSEVMVPPSSDLRDDLHKRLMQKLAVQEEQMEGLRRHNEVLQEQLQTLQFASTNMQEGDEMEREARKYAEQQAEIFREKATDLDQRLHKQMAKTQDLFEANKEMANRLMRAEEESQFRLTELQTELDSMREERDELTMSTNTLTNGMQNLTVRIEELQAENNGLQEQVLSLQAAQHRQQQEVASLAEAKEQLTKRHEKALDSMITLETDNGKLNKQNQELAYKLKVANESSAATTNWRHKYEEVRQQGAVLHQKYQEKKALVERLMAELAAEKREKEDIFAICDQLLKEREAGKAQ